MTQRDLFVDAFDLKTVSYEIHEAADVADKSPNAGLVDGINILARVVGTFFLVDGKSRNGRFYTKELWQTAIKRTNDRIEAGQMLGTIGHSQPLDDAALLQGLASHRVARLWIDEKNGVGMGEILVLNTPSGRVLNAYLRGGVKFPVSSRGYGGFRNGKRDGAPIIDEDSFELETFDFVRVAGVAIALPALVESLDTEAQKVFGDIREALDCSADPLNPMCQLNTTNPNFEEERMSNDTAATIAVLARQKAQVEDDLTTAYSENEILRGKNENLQTAKTVNDKRIVALEEELAGATRDLANLNGYKSLGTVEAIQEVFTRFSAMNAKAKELSGVVNEKAELATELESYKAFGSVEEVSQALDIAETLMTDAETTVSGAATMAEEFSEIGTPEEINGALDLLEAYAAMATPAELAEAAELLAEYVELGSVSEVETLVARTEQMAESLLAQKQQAAIQEMAAETGAPLDVVSEMLESLGAENTRNILGRLKSPSHATPEVSAKAKKPALVLPHEVEDEDEDEANDVADDADFNESFDAHEAASHRSRAGSLTESLMAQFSSVTEDTVELSESAPRASSSTAGLFASCG